MRIATRAVIIENGKVLLCRYTDENGEFFVCPGGGQDENETMIENVKRELKEELDVEIEVGDMAFTRETSFVFEDVTYHQIEHYFYCTIIGCNRPTQGKNVDKTCTGFDWVDINAPDNIRTFPQNLKKLLEQRCSSTFVDNYK